MFFPELWYDFPHHPARLLDRRNCRGRSQLCMARVSDEFLAFRRSRWLRNRRRWKPDIPSPRRRRARRSGSRRSFLSCRGSMRNWRKSITRFWITHWGSFVDRSNFKNVGEIVSKYFDVKYENFKILREFESFDWLCTK